MTEMETANLLETADLTGGVVIYDLNGITVIDHSIHREQYLSKARYLFIVENETSNRIGIIQDMGDDIDIYIKPMYRSLGYTTLVMREIVPYWMPELVSITSFFPYQDAKIEYLASCANLRLRSKNASSDEMCNTWREMSERGRATLLSSEYARAIQDQDIEALRACADKVSNPRKLSENYGTPDTEFRKDIACNNRIDITTGRITLPRVNYKPLDFHNTTPEEIYEVMHRLCHCSVVNDDEYYVTFTPYDATVLAILPPQESMQLDLSYVRIDKNKICIAINVLYSDAYEWAQNQILKLDESNCAHYEWGIIQIEDEYCVNFMIYHDFAIDDIHQLVENHKFRAPWDF